MSDNEPERSFNPADHTRQLRSRSGQTSAYLDVKWRLVWMRDRHPDATIETVLVTHEPNVLAVVKAVVTIPLGNGQEARSTGYGMETESDFRDYLEKAETKAIGRALAHAGFGTQFIAEDAVLADAPLEAPPSVNGDGTPGAASPLPEQAAAITRLWTQLYGISDIRPRLHQDFGVGRTGELSPHQAGKLIKALQEELFRERAAATIPASSQP